MKSILFFISGTAFLVGCAKISVYPVKNTSGSTGQSLSAESSGIRFYRPALHVWITKIAPSDKINTLQNQKTTNTYDEAPSKDDSKKGDKEKNPLVKSIDITTSIAPLSSAPTVYQTQFVMLPDYSQEYILQWKPGIGSVNPNITLQDGWNLTAFNSTADSQTDELATALGTVVTSAITGGAAGLSKGEQGNPFKGAGLYKIIFDSKGTISLGERVISLED